jgi:hypothetical protein
MTTIQLHCPYHHPICLQIEEFEDHWQRTASVVLQLIYEHPRLKPAYDPFINHYLWISTYYRCTPDLSILLQGLYDEATKTPLSPEEMETLVRAGSQELIDQ